MTMSKSSVTLPPVLPSLAVTRTVTVPVSPDCGVLENVREPAVNVSHVGRAEPSDCSAV